MLRHEWLFLVGAAMVHTGLPIGAAIAPDPPAFMAKLSRQRRAELEVDVEDAFLKPEWDTYGRARDSRGARRPVDGRVPRARPRTGAKGDPRAVDPGEVLLGPEDGDSGDTIPDPDWDAPPSEGEIWGTPGVDPNLPYWAYPGADLPDSTPSDDPAPRRTKKRKYDKDKPTEIVQDGIRNKDKKLGLDFPGRGPIREAFVSATYSSDAPYECQAVFALSVSPAGKVTAVSYVSHSGGTAGTWKAVGKAAQGQLKSAKLVMKSAFAKGAAVTVVITSKKKTPGGGASRDGTTINFDVTDVGAKATRIVGASVAAVPVK